MFTKRKAKQEQAASDAAALAAQHAAVFGAYALADSSLRVWEDAIKGR